MSWLVKTTYYVNDDDQVSVLQGPFATKDEAEAYGADTYPTIDDWHDAHWDLVSFRDPGPIPGVRYVETEAP